MHRSKLRNSVKTVQSEKQILRRKSSLKLFSSIIPIFVAAVLIATIGFIFSASVPPKEIASAAAPPVVNGLFYGDGDYKDYWLYSQSEYGSGLYVFFDDPIVYLALVVTRTVNDNVCGPNDPDKPYTTDAGWIPHRDCKRNSDSEYASWTLRCTSLPNYWYWIQGYTFEDSPNHYVSDNAHGEGTGASPPGYTSSSSMAWNWNNYKAKNYFNGPPPGDAPWDMYIRNGSVPTTDEVDFKSPFDPSNEFSVTGHLQGYPVTGPITYSNSFQYEWAMVYEWSADVSICGEEPLYIITGESHHSPIKNGDTDENDDFDDQDPFLDFGDLPDTYSTYTATNGAAHIWISGAPRLGGLIDFEKDGNPTTYATGDDTNSLDDHDGVTRDSTTNWQLGSVVSITLDVQNIPITDTAVVGMWIDWDQNGTFEGTEYYTFTNLTLGANVVSLTVPDDQGYDEGDPLNVRVRIFSDETAAPGGILDSSDFAGVALGGEVEDYNWTFGPTSVTLTSFTAGSSSSSSITVVLIGLIGVVVTGIIIRRRKLL